MKRVFLSLAGFWCVATASAQVPSLPTPTEPSVLAPIGGEPGVDALRVELDRSRLARLTQLDSVSLVGVPMPDGTVVDLDLVRIRHERMKFDFTVNDAPRPDLLRALDLSLWKGVVRGAVDTEVQLSFSRTGASGWIRREGALVHVLPRRDARGDWTRGDSLLVDESVLNAVGMHFDGSCAAGEIPGQAAERNGPLTRIPRALEPVGGSIGVSGSGCGLRECRIAITSDFQWYQKFNDLSAQTAYTATLLGFVSDRYETQASTLLTFPSVAFYTTAADPWAAQDVAGNDCQDVLTELQAAWVGNLPANADLGHLMSGANLGCGIAWLDALCSPNFNFSVSGNLNGTITFPIQQQPNNWDFIVVAHEIGHNFDALHSHDYCPPLDECPPTQYFGQCQTQQVCSNQGSIMSYCHLCSGGTANITTFFHPTSAADMTAAAAACLPLLADISANPPTIVAPNVATPVSVTVAGTPIGPVQLLWRPNASTAFAAINLVNAGNGLWTGSLPPLSCGDSPNFYFAFSEATCGLLTAPNGAPANTYSVDVTVLATAFLDNFQTNSGWTPSNLGATSGDWQRGVPVNDANWEYDPIADGDGSGSCWLTQNGSGNTDVDGGSVQLLSPALNLSSTTATLEYRYFLRLTGSGSNDELRVEASASGTGGPWATVAVHNTDGALTWRLHQIRRSDFVAAGITPTATTRLRFTATDANPGHIVEAGLDALRIAVGTCTAVGANYCSATTNSSGGSANISATGSASIAANNLVLQAAPVPASSTGLFYFGPTQTQTTFGNGFRCVTGTIRRLGIVPAAGGALTRVINNSVPPSAGVLVAGSTWNFQAWFRDVAAGGSNFNLSNGLRIPFAP